jgi:hypothetical protein
MAVVGEEDLVAVEVLREEAVTQAVVVAVVVSVEPRTSQAGPRASEAEVACHRSDRTSLRGPAG